MIDLRKTEVRTYAVEDEAPRVTRFFTYKRAKREAERFVGYVLLTNRWIRETPALRFWGHKPLTGMRVEVAVNNEVKDRWSW